MRTITLLRDPVRCVISLYHCFRRWTPHPLCAIITKEQLALADFFRHDACVPYLRTSQTYHLAFQEQVWTSRAVALALGGPADRLEQRREAAAAFSVESPAVLLGRARQRLGQMEFVGLADRLPESVELLSHTLNWLAFPEAPRLNLSPDSGPLALASRTIIEDLTRLDREVHVHAFRLFEASLASGVSHDPRAIALPSRQILRLPLASDK